MKRIYLASLFCLFSLASFGNEEENFIPGQVIRTDGSRISALVKVPVSADEKTVIIKDSETGENTTLESNDIRSITVVEGGKTIQYVFTKYVNNRTKRESASVWLKTISWGELILYSGEWNGRTIFFIKQNGDNYPVQLGTNDYKEMIMPLISDHAYLAKDVDNGKYTYNGIGQILDEYNSWKSFE